MAKAKPKKKRQKKLPKVLKPGAFVAPKEVNFSDKTKGVIVGDVAYRRLPSGQMMRLGTALDDGSILPDEYEEDKKKKKGEK